MRLVVSLLMVALGSSIALADAPAPAPTPAPAAAPAALPPIPLRVVRVMPESHQALLFDRTRGTHVLAEVGQQIDGYVVETIADDMVTLRAIGAGPAVVLAAPDRSWRHHDAPAPADPYAPTTVSPTPSAPGPADPYAPAPVASAPQPGDPYAPVAVAPGDPYADASASTSTTPVRVVEAPAVSQPITAGDGGMRTVDAAAPAGPATTVSPAAISAPAMPTPATPPATQLTPSDEAEPELVLTHAQLGTELADFNGLAASISATFGAGGIHVDTVAAGSLFARAGLRAGDIISAVNGQPLRSLDDAAELYATASSARNISITIVRAGKPTALHVTIK